MADDIKYFKPHSESWRAELGGREIGRMSLSPMGPFASPVRIDESFRRKGIATELYRRAEEDIGRRLIPSPLGLSPEAISFWKRRLSGMPVGEAQQLLTESLEIAEREGVGKTARKNLSQLGVDFETIEPRPTEQATVPETSSERLIELRQAADPPRLPEIIHEPEHPRITPGRVLRGLVGPGSKLKAARRLFTLAQQGYQLLPEEYQLLGDVLNLEELAKPLPGTGRGFRGLEYFRQMLGRVPPAPTSQEEREQPTGIVSLPDLREPAPVYYSAVARAVDALPMERGAGEQMLAMVSNSRGVKPEEMQWMGLPEFLDKKSVTKQEIQDFVGANQLDIEEVVRSEGAMTDAFESSFAEGSIDEDRAYATDWDVVLDRIGDTPDRQPLFEQYTLPGGENYREVAFTLPGIAENFTGSHLEIPNTLAHVRLNDRTGPNGEKILFVEEIQSDWHKKGRTEGYKTSEFTNHNADIDGQVDDLMQRRTGINADLSENFNLGGTVLPDGNGVLWYSRDIIENNDFKNIGRIYENGSFYIDEGFSEANPAAAAKLKELAEIAAEVGNLNQSRSMVPDAPLKKTWYEMVFRRVARMAAEGGYDSVAWTPGEVQAERYDLSKEVSTIEVTPMPDGTFKISPMLIDDDVPRVLHVEADQLDYTLGAELADKVRQQEERVAALGVEGLTRVYEGIDLKIGGEKLKGLYDGRIKNYASEFGKKFGARVGTMEINPYDDGAISGERIMERLGIPESDWDEHWRNLTQDRRDELVEQYRRRFEGTKVWNLPITPEMKEELLTQGIQKFAHGGFIDKPFYDRAAGGFVGMAEGGLVAENKTGIGAHMDPFSPGAAVFDTEHQLMMDPPSVALGDLDYRSGLEPVLNASPLARYGYALVEQASPGNVSRHIKHVMGKRGPLEDWINSALPPNALRPRVLLGEHPTYPLFGTSVRGIYSKPHAAGGQPPVGTVRMNLTDRDDKRGTSLDYGNVSRTEDVAKTTGHELEHLALHNLGGFDVRGDRRFMAAEGYDHDLIFVLDALKKANETGILTVSYEASEDRNARYVPIAAAILRGSGFEDLAPWERAVAEHVVRVSNYANERLSEMGYSTTPFPGPLNKNEERALELFDLGQRAEESPKTIEKAAGGFIDKPLYNDRRMIS